MSSHISERMRKNLSQSLPIIEQHKEDLVARMAAGLRSEQPDGRGPDHSEVVAMMLAELLLGQAHKLIDSGGLGDLRDVAAEHAALDIYGRHYSRFGDLLVPTLKDLLGANAPAEIPSAWSDCFWAIVRAAGDAAVQHRRELAHA